MDREKESREANRKAFSARARRGDAAAREVLDEALETLIEWSHATKSDRVLDLATGGGYLARSFAPHVAWSLGVDLVMDMVVAARRAAHDEGHANTGFLVAVVENLPLVDASLDLVMTRRGPHHFADIRRALDEIARVLKPGGRLLVEDLIVPEDPDLAAWINAFEKICSPSHGRALPASEWRALLEERGFVVEHLDIQERSRDLTPVLQRSSAADRAKIQEALLSLDDRWAASLGYEAAGPRWTTHTILLAARR